MTKTRVQLVERALRKLGALPAGQSAAPEDALVVDDEIDGLMADLAERNIYVWGDPDQIEEAAFVHLADILANSVARTFGVQQDEVVRRAAESRLKLLDPQFLSGQPLKVEYF